MTFSMKHDIVVTLDHLHTFSRTLSTMIVNTSSRAQKYVWIEKILERFFYFSMRKKNKQVIKEFIMGVTGYSDAQLTRLIAEKKKTKKIAVTTSSTHAHFKMKYTTDDVALLACTDEAHGRLSGKATKKLFARAFNVFHDKGYLRLKDISVSHLYNLRGRRQYRSSVSIFTKTRPVPIPIGKRRKPDPKGKPGYIRVDSVHQGDKEKAKGVYHINFVDEVTQWELVAAVEGISEGFLAGVLETVLFAFPFRVIEFHSDNGSEYINYVVAKLLQKMMIEQTKSRPRKCNDNALVESKNGSVIRKHMGYAHIPKQHASKINTFYETHFNEYLNFHRPCGYATIITNKKGKETKKYDVYETPYEHFKQLPKAASYLREGNTFEILDAIAAKTSDFECATLMQKAKQQLFKSFS